MTRRVHCVLPVLLFVAVLIHLSVWNSPSFGQNKTVMIVAPHEDDEAMAMAGVIYAAKLRGDTVRVVLSTNGDYNGTATGYARMATSVRAMSLLGLSEDEVIFLGYGDGNSSGASLLRDLYQSPSDATVFTSRAGQVQTYANRGLGRVDYHTYLNGRPGDYNRATILQDFKALLSNFHPDEVYTTSYHDGHDDHACTYLFIMEALTALKRAGAQLPTRVHDTFIWASVDPYNPWPAPGVTPALPLTKPPSIVPGPYVWEQVESVPVPSAMQDADLISNLKYQTIQQYAPNDWQRTFVKKNEIFWLHACDTNLALIANVEVSSEDAVNHARKAIDGVINGQGNAGFAGDWVASNEQSGAWIRLSWPSPVTVSRIVLYDRPIAEQQILGGTLNFSDGTSLNVGALPNNGSPFHIPFTPRTITSVEFDITNATGSYPTGLSEFEVYGVSAGSAGNHAPQFASGPVADEAEITELQTANLSASGFDVDGDTVQYEWLADAGTINGSGSNVTFLPPSVVTDTVVTITLNLRDATGGTATNTTFVTVHPSEVKMKSLTVSPTAIEGGNTATGTATLGSVAPSGGKTVTLGSSDAALASVPSSITIPAGSTTTTFSITTYAVNSPTVVTISAYAGGITQTANLTVTQPAVPVASLSVSPVTVPGGDTATATVTLRSAAIGAGTVVALSSNSGSAIIPDTVTVQGGATSSTFSISTKSVTASTSATIGASAGGTSASADLRIGARIAVNLATTSSVSVSTEVPGQLGLQAIDRIVDGYPWDSGKEWATYHETAGAWIKLTFPGPASVSQVALYDRMNTTDNILSGTLSFSDGSTVSVGMPPANGAPLTVSFSPRTATWVQFHIDSAEGLNIGLAEIAVYGSTVTAVSSVNLSPTSVVGGATSNATVTLSAPAPSGGAVVNLSSNNTAVATVPSTVTVPANATTAAFAVSTMAVASATTVNISASYGGATQSATLTVAPSAVSVSSLVINPSTVVGGNAATATVTLSTAVTGNDAIISISTSDPTHSTVPASVTVPVGSSSASFTISTAPVSAPVAVTIDASYNESVKSATLNITPVAASIASVTLNPTSVAGGGSSTVTVTLTGSAPSGGAVVSLSSSNTAIATVPATVTIPGGATTAVITVATSSVSADATVTITATYGGSASATLQVTAAALNTLTLSPATIAGGNASTGTINLSSPAPAGGTIIALTSSNPSAASVPASVTVGGGATTATFAINTTVVATSTTVTISGSSAGTTRTATLTISPVALSSLRLNPTSLRGGATSTGTVTLTVVAPTGGAVISLTSNNTEVASTPATVTVAAGSTTATFAVTTVPVSAATVVTISALYNGMSRTGNLTVNPPALSSLALAPTTVIGGSSSTGTVTLGTAAPAGGTVIALSSNNAVAALPASVTVPAGATTATFIVDTVPLATNTSLTITATYSGVIRTASLTVRAANVSTLVLDPPTVTGGKNSTGIVTLTGPAPATGLTLDISSGRPGITTVPATVLIPAGQTSGEFTINTMPVTRSYSVAISASYGNTTRRASLVVTP